MNDSPVAPSQPRAVYHGYQVLAALFLAGFMVYGGGLYCFVLFIPPLTTEFQWSRAATSSLVTAFWLGAPLILFGGWGIKRFGATRLLVTGILIEACCVALLSRVFSFGEMYLLRAAMGVGKVLFAVTLPYAVARWFSRNHSFALGVVWAGWQVGGMVLVPVAGEIIVRYGWRTACVAIAVGLLTIGLLPVLATRRPGSPAALGLGLDGDPLTGGVQVGGARRGGAQTGGARFAAAARAGPAESTVAAPPSGSLGDLLRSSAFWLIALGTLFFFTTYGGLLTHEASIVQGAGYSPRLSATVLGSTAGFAALGCLGTGWMLDRFSLARIGIALHVALLIGAVSLLSVDRLQSPAALVTYAACFGWTIGGGDLYFVALLRRRFPAVSLAYSYSAWYFCQIFTLLIAGPAAGRVYDLTGNYAVTLELLSGSAVLALLSMLPVLRGLRRLRSGPGA